MTEYLQAYTGRGVATARYRLLAFFRLSEGDRPLTAINAPHARKLYETRTGEVAVDTHRGELGYAKRFIDWCIAQGWIRVNPFTDVKPVGEKKRGKPKLRVNGTRQFLAVLLEDQSLEATAVLTALMLGLRANEVVKRTVDDLDDDGRLLWIRDSKTEYSDREIEVPELLRVRLLALAAGRGRHEKLFGAMTRHGLHYHTVRLCRVAGVDRVTPHGLRGSGATTAVRLGGGIEQVAEAVGHADARRGAQTLKAHYLGGGALESARGRRLEIIATPVVSVEKRDPLAHTVTATHNQVISNPNETRSDLVTPGGNDVTNPNFPEVN